ncbi:MAG: Rpn family recombination-promoting nuclease/putative transposase [Gammaproteobacteria bacterium]
MDINNTPSHPHDYFARKMLSDVRVAREFFKAHLPKELMEIMDLDILELQQRSTINDVRKETVVDLLYKTKIAGRDAFLYLLIEHQSTPDRFMPFRLHKYIINHIEEYLNSTGASTFPLFYPIVIYHGEKPYSYSNNINDLVDAPKELVSRYFLQPFHLIDLGKIEDEILKKHTWAGVVELALKHIFARDMLPYLQDMAELMHRINLAGGENVVEVVLEYILDIGEINNKNVFFQLVSKQISPRIGRKVMNLKEQFRIEGLQEGRRKGLQEGRQEGRQEEKFEIARKLLAENVDPVFIVKITGLPLVIIREMQITNSN